MSTELAKRIAAEHAAAAQSLPSAVVARARRRRAVDALISVGLPTTRDENWRYASLRPLERVRFTPAPAGVELAAEALPPPIPGYARYVFLDGVLDQALSCEAAPAPGVTVHARSRTGSAADALTAESAEPSADSAFALLNEAFALDCAQVDAADAAPGTAAPACIEIVFVAGTPAHRGSSYPRLRVHAAPRARLCLVERYVSLAVESDGRAHGRGSRSGGDDPGGPSDASFVDSVVEVSIAEGASVDHYRVQQLGARAVWMDTLSTLVARSGAYRLHAIGLGALSARSTVRVRLGGEGAELALHAVAVGDRQQVLDTHAIVEHAAASTRTEESFRGVAAGRSRVAFNGKIIVQPAARGADSTQSLRGLLAGATAEIDVRPQLEIYTDEVRCSHGATAGKLDETMLFYLLSRGLDGETAQRLLKWAFLEDVVSRIDVAELRRQIERSLAGRLPESDALKELL
jgi:Fe-S cluster assembly protein SufD